MKPALDTGPRRFFTTPRTSCPYIDDRLERKVFTELAGNEAADLHDALATAGFRRSQNIIYKPLCDGCAACVAVRVRSLEFRLRRWMRRATRLYGQMRVKKVTLTEAGMEGGGKIRGISRRPAGRRAPPASDAPVGGGGCELCGDFRSDSKIPGLA